MTATELTTTGGDRARSPTALEEIAAHAVARV